MGGKRHTLLRLAAVALVLSLVGPLLPAGGAEPPGQTPDLPPDTGLKMRMLGQLQDLGAPEIFTDMITQQEASVEEGRFTTAGPFPDLNNDGVAEVAEATFVYRIRISDSQTDLNQIVVESIRTKIRIRRGTDGKVHWTKTYDDFVIPVPARVGAPARPGVLALGGLLSFFGGGAGERYFNLEALDGSNGRRQWGREYRSVGGSYDFTASVTTNSPVSISLFQGLPGSATDVLVGLGDYVETPLTRTVAVRTVAVDGEQGEEVAHTNVDVGIDWIPYPIAISDSDGDGLDDYAVANNNAVDPGGPQEPPSFGGVLYARRGTDGAEIWTTGGLTLLYYAGLAHLPNVVGGGARDVGLVTYHPSDEQLLPAPLPELPISFINAYPVVMLFDGANGYHRWTKPGEWLFSPGDVSGDGTDDVVVERVKANKKRLRYEQHAFTGADRKLWTHDVTWNPKDCLAGACFRRWFGWGGRMGDVQPDALTDTFVDLGMWEDPGGEERKTHVMDARSGRVLYRSGDTLSPAMTAIDGDGSDLLTLQTDASSLTITARAGTSGRPLWRTELKGPEELLKKRTYPWGAGFSLPGDACGDIVVSATLRSHSFYAILAGADGKMLWSFWSGARADRPRVTDSIDRNFAC